MGMQLRFVLYLALIVKIFKADDNTGQKLKTLKFSDL